MNVIFIIGNEKVFNFREVTCHSKINIPLISRYRRIGCFLGILERDIKRGGCWVSTIGSNVVGCRVGSPLSTLLTPNPILFYRVSQPSGPNIPNPILICNILSSNSKSNSIFGVSPKKLNNFLFT